MPFNEAGLEEVASVFAGGQRPIVPNLSPNVGALMGVMTADDVEFDEVVRQIELHPVILARLIGLANSAWAAPGQPIDDPERACIHLGLSVVKSASIAYALANTFKTTLSESFDPVRFWACALLAGETATRLSVNSESVDSSARTPAMLRQLGLLWLVHDAPDRTELALKRQQDFKLGLNESLRAYVGIDHLEATRILFEAWELPESTLHACTIPSQTPDAAFYSAGAKIASAAYDNCSEFEASLCPDVASEILADAFSHAMRHRERTMILAQNLSR